MTSNKVYSSLVLAAMLVFSSQDMQDSYFASLVDFLYEKYPLFIPRLLAYNGTKIGNDILVINSTGYKGGVIRETKFKDGYGVFVANSFRQFYENGRLKSSSNNFNVMYKCDTAIRYCSGNAAYCHYHEGERGSQLIIVAGHDGALIPDSIPDRDVGCWLPKAKKCHFRHNCEDKKNGIFKNRDRCKVELLDDVGTIGIAEFIQDALEKVMGKRPHLIVSRLHRRKLDVNRNLPKGTFHVGEAVRAYNDFHGFIKRAIDNIDGEWGLLLDIHGNNRQKRTMLGYGLEPFQYEQGYFISNDSTIQHLADHVEVSLEKLIRGRNSLGHIMEKRGIKTVPSPKQPIPDNTYLWGGYIVKEYGSQGGRKVDAIQIEIPNGKRDSDDDEQVKYLNEIAESISEYIDLNYNKKGKEKIDAETLTSLTKL